MSRSISVQRPKGGSYGPSSSVAFDDGPFDLARKIARRLLVLALLENDGVLVLSTSVLDAFDRLEVLDATAEMGLFFTPRSTPRSLPSRARPLLCAGLI